MVADPDVLAPDLVEIVERGASDRRAGDLLVGVFALAMLSALIGGIALLTGRGGPADRRWLDRATVPAAYQ